ncbi:hypothetical protein BYT27DRAFT_7190763 [Phlegmacium glaucopus]|nr:hypothetical protein BYT27DRAFT_7190763 [Phlegmacium glaucopus]
MFSTLITVALFVSLAIQGASAGFAINTPNIVQCEPVKVSWASASPPYNIEVVSATDPCGPALDTIWGLTATLFDYSGKVAAGTEVVLYISDSAGNEAWSGNITVGASSNKTCIPGASSIAIPSTPTTPVINATPAGSSPSSKSSIVPLGGAINAGTNINGAFSVRQASTPLLVIAVLAGMLAVTL